MTKKLFAAAIIIAAILIGFLLINQRNERLKNLTALPTGTLLSRPVDIQTFELIDDHGKLLTKKNLRGHWTLIFFGFTNCPTTCTAALAELNKAYTQFNAIDKNNAPKVLFISVDPQHDTNKRIRHYLASFNRNFWGATGDQETLDNLTNQAKTLFMKTNKLDKNNLYRSGIILVSNPKAQWVGALTSPHRTEALTLDLLNMQKTYQHSN